MWFPQLQCTYSTTDYIPETTLPSNIGLASNVLGWPDGNNIAHVLNLGMKMEADQFIVTSMYIHVQVSLGNDMGTNKTFTSLLVAVDSVDPCQKYNFNDAYGSDE